MCLQPRRKPLVKVGARRLRDAVVGGVADECMVEAESFLRCGRVGTDELLAAEREQARLDALALLGPREVENCLEREAAARDRRALEHARARSRSSRSSRSWRTPRIEPGIVARRAVARRRSPRAARRRAGFPPPPRRSAAGRRARRRAPRAAAPSRRPRAARARVPRAGSCSQFGRRSVELRSRRGRAGARACRPAGRRGTRRSRGTSAPPSGRRRRPRRAGARRRAPRGSGGGGEDLVARCPRAPPRRGRPAASSSRSGQKVIALPVRRAAADEHCRLVRDLGQTNSRANRDFPIPGSPTSTTCRAPPPVATAA